MLRISLSMNNVTVRLLQKRNKRRLTKKGTLPIRNAPLLVETSLSAPGNLTNVVAQETSVATASLTVTTWHGTHVLVITFDIPTIVSPQACWSIVLKTSPLVIVMNIATHAINIALEAALVIGMITGIVIASQPLVITKARVTMLNTVANLDQSHNQDQGPVLVILEAQDTIMITTFIMMTTGEEKGRVYLLFPLV